MQHDKRGNPHRCKRRRKPCPRPVAVLPIFSAQPHQGRPSASAQLAGAPPAGLIRLSLYDVDPITGEEDLLYSLFYEDYRGYTIYSTEQGRCCIHGRCGGCLRIESTYACFPDIEEAKKMIKLFQASGRTPYEGMDRYVQEDAYRCLNRARNWQRGENRPQYCLVGT